MRSVILLLVSPLIWLVYNFLSEAAGIKMLIFFSLAGLKKAVIESVARGVLPKFYLEDMHSIAYNVFTACGRRYVVTANPRIMVEPFLKEYLGVEAVMGTELVFSTGVRHWVCGAARGARGCEQEGRGGEILRA